jgi:isoquinoline 1-oxidoreductase subunit beta
MARLQHRTVDEALSLSRRGFLIAMAGATAVFGFPRDAKAAMDPATPTGAPPTAANPLFEPTIWFSIDGDGFVTVNIIRAEMGQHVGTALARILADELEADWDKVRIVHVDTDPKWGLMITGASWSVWLTWPVFSRAGAAGRMALIDEGAKLLNVSPTACTARGGAVVASEQKISYGEIVSRGRLDRRYTSKRARLLLSARLARISVGHDRIRKPFCETAGSHASTVSRRSS